MQIVMGVKEYETGHAMIQYLEQLQFPDPQVCVVHVNEPPGGGTLGNMLLTAGEGEFIAQYMNNQDFIAHTMGHTIYDELRQHGIKAEMQVLNGSPGELLLEISRSRQADLILMHMPQKGTVGGLFGARVARKLLMEADTSLLIHRSLVMAQPIRGQVVFATDHSPYAERCLQRLVEMKPQGLQRITVMTAYQRDLLSSLKPFVSQLRVDPGRWVEDKLHEENSRTIQKLEAAGWRCASEVREGNVHEAIEASMTQNNADLLILGAQGHGFVKRLTMGSVSLHEALYGRYPILLLRLAVT